jgi:hypothetical protein
MKPPWEVLPYITSVTILPISESCSYREFNYDVSGHQASFFPLFRGGRADNIQLSLRPAGK